VTATEREESHQRLIRSSSRTPLAISATSLALTIIMAIAVVPQLSASTAQPVAQQVVDNNEAKEEAARDAQQDQAIEDLSHANAERAAKGLPPVQVSQSEQDAVVNATLARVIDLLPDGTDLTAAQIQQIANEAADIVQGRIIIPKAEDVIPCLSEPDGCRGPQGIQGEQGVQGEVGPPCDPAETPDCRGPQGPAGEPAPVPVSQRLEQQDQTCFLVTVWQRPDQSTFELKAAAADVCPTTPTTTSSDPAPEEPLRLPG
jgi:hypothetical protein